MITKTISWVASDFISLSLVTFLLLYLVYIVVIKIHLYRYRLRHDSKPVHYKNFRLYSQSLISNAPSKKEKKFYAETNKITYFFNSLVIVAFVIYIFVCFF